MSIKLMPYPKTFRSPVSWVDTLPLGWKVQRAKFLFSCIDIRSPDGSEELLTVSSADGVRKRSDKVVTMFMASSYVGYKLCWPSDLVVNSLWAWATGFGFSQYHGIVSSAYGVYRLRSELGDDSKYFHHLLRSRAYDLEFTVRSKGIWVSRLQLTDEAFLDMPILVPPAEDRKAIVRFIHYLDQRVNRLIRTKRKFIELLNEQKQAIIHRAVTKGLDPTVPLKPSGIDWLGEIPIHWKVKSIKRTLISMDYGTSESSTDGGKVRILTMGHIRDSEIIVPKSGGLDKISESLILEKNDLLFNRTNSPDLVGKVGIFRGASSDRVSFASYLVRLRANDETNPFWLNYLLNSREFWRFAKSQALVSLHQANLNATKYGQMQIPVPPLQEQRELFKMLDASLEGLRLAIGKAGTEIDLIREYRTRLVADVVTGQLDVRHLDLPEVEEQITEELEDSDLGELEEEIVEELED